MKVYRFCNWSNNPYNGSLNEKYNLIHLGLISPSNNYLRTTNVFQDGINTFQEDMPMCKFFFSSLADAIVTAASLVTNHHGEITLMEVDFPNSLLNQSIGLGYYGNIQVEFCIPYLEMYNVMKKEANDYTIPALEFYNANMYRYIDLSRLEQYQELEKLLPKVANYQQIWQDYRLSIYPLFCFIPKEINLTIIFKENRSYYGKIAKELQRIREDKYHFGQELKLITKASDDLFEFDHDFSKNELFHFTRFIIDEENKILRKTLFK